MIPKIVHQIWIGPNPIPQKVIPYIDTVKQKFDDYEYMFWDNSNLPELPKNCQEIFNSKRYKLKPALQADVIRYFVLNQYGGLYLDIDFYVKERFDHLFTKDFFCVRPNKIGWHCCNGVFACEKNNPILTKIITEMKPEVYHGPLLFSKYILEYMGLSYGSNVFQGAKSNDYVKCEDCDDFFNAKGRYAYHDALKSWL